MPHARTCVRAQAQVTKQWAVDAPYPAMMHDCGLTEHFALLLQLPLTFLPKAGAGGHACYHARR